MPDLTVATPIVYERPDRGERASPKRRSPDCSLIARRTEADGICPDGGEIITPWTATTN